MSERSVKYRCSPGVSALFSDEVVGDMVKRTVDSAYERNLTIGQGVYTKRFNVFTVDGKVVSRRESEQAARTNPGSVGQVLPIVALSEEAGEDEADVVLQSEVEKMSDATSELKALLNQPPNITVEKFIASCVVTDGQHRFRGA
jgi:hypothetical protein